MCIHRERRRPFGRILFCVLMVLSADGVARDAPAAEPQKVVLALYDGRVDLPANVLVDEIIRSTLERELGPRLDFYAEFLDVERWPESETQTVFRNFLRRRYAQKKVSVIIAVARPAINFMRMYGNELFPGVPVVAYGDSDALRDWEPGRPITGTLGKLDLSGTVELMLRLQPRTREILVISGTSASDQWLRSVARPQFGEFEKRVKFTYLNGVAVQDLLRTVARAPDGTAILFLSMLQDSAGNKLLSQEVLARIAKAARVPVYSQGGIYVGLGVVGGVVFDPESLGHETAQLTLRILRGERIQDLPVQQSKSSVPMVDWRQMQRWGLSEKRLPAGTVIRFREPSVWQTYKWYIATAIGLILLEALLIGGLIWQRAQNRKTQTALSKSEEKFAMAFQQSPLSFTLASLVDYRLLEVNETFERYTGWTRDEVIGRTSLQINFWVDMNHRSTFIEQLRTTGAVRNQEILFRKKDGEVRAGVASSTAIIVNGELCALSLIADVTEAKQAENARRESEQRFRLIANTAPVMIWMASPDKLCNYVNPPWLEFTGRSLEAELGNGWAEGIHPEDLKACLASYVKAFDERGTFKMQYRIRRHDGEYRWIFDLGVPRFEPDGSFAGYIGSCIDVTERKLAEEALSVMSRRLIQAQEQERTRIARELHDDINQRVAMLAIELDALEQRTPDSAVGLRTSLDGLRLRLLELGNEIQGISHRLHSSKLEYLGLVAACRSFCKEVAERHKVTIDFTAEGVRRGVPEDISLCLFRVLQEALTNAIKHSGTQHFEARLREVSGEIELSVRDFGVGFDGNATMNTQGLGLISMRERVGLVGGTVLITSQPMGGTEITVRAPFVLTKGAGQTTAGAA